MSAKVEEQLPFIRNDLFKVPDKPGEKPYLVGSRCKLCGRHFFPRRTVCFHCKEPSLEDVPLSRTGRLDAGTVAQVAPVGFNPPYVVGYVILPEGLRFFSQLIVEGVPPEKAQAELRPGRSVELVIDRIRADDRGKDVMGFKFKLI